MQSTTGNITAAGLTTTGSLDVTNNTTIGGTLGVTGQITGNVTGDLTGTADKSNLVDVTETATSNLTYYPTFVSANSGYTEIRTDSQNLSYNPSTNTLTVDNFKSVTDFEIQGNLNVTGALTFFQSQVGSIANHDTDALAEGVTNLYFTDERVDDRVAALISGGTGISATYDDLGNLLTLSAVQSDINTDNLTEGSTNLFTTATRTRSHFTYGTGIQLSTGDLSIAFNEFTSDDIVEGSTNLFITDARVRGALSASGDLNYNASTGEFSISQSDLNVDDLISLTGRANGATHLAAFAGSTITDNNTIKGALGELETAVEARALTSSLSTVATSGAYTDLTGLPTLGTAAATAAADYATAAQGALADSAIQPADLATVATTGAYADLSGTPTLAAVATSNDYNDLTNLPTLFSGAYADLTGLPTLFSGAYADLTGLPTLFSGAYADLTGKPTLGTAAATASTDYATAAQGALADSALQAETIDLTTLKSVVAASSSFSDFQTRIAAL